MTRFAPCPDCEANVAIPADAMQNELIACPDCAADLEIVALEPLTLAPRPAH